MPSKVIGAKEVADDIRASVRSIGPSVDEALAAAQRQGRDLVIRRQLERYNLRREKVEPLVRSLTLSKNAKRATLEIQIRAAAIENFDPRVKMIQATIKSRAGRTFTRLLPATELSLYRQKPLRLLPGAFPLHQRRNGLLQPGDRIRARIGRPRDKLKKFRYVTFPKSLLDPIIKEAEDLAGDTIGITFRAAFRYGNGRLGRNR